MTEILGSQSGLECAPLDLAGGIRVGCAGAVCAVLPLAMTYAMKSKSSARCNTFSKSDVLSISKSPTTRNFQTRREQKPQAASSCQRAECFTPRCHEMAMCDDERVRRNSGKSPVFACSECRSLLGDVLVERSSGGPQRQSQSPNTGLGAFGSE